MASLPPTFFGNHTTGWCCYTGRNLRARFNDAAFPETGPRPDFCVGRNDASCPKSRPFFDVDSWAYGGSRADRDLVGNGAASDRTMVTDDYISADLRDGGHWGNDTRGSANIHICEGAGGTNGSIVCFLRRPNALWFSAMLAKDLLDILVCPKCKGDLTYLPEQNALDCHACSLRYRIEDDIPVMLIDEAKPLEGKASADR